MTKILLIEDDEIMRENTLEILKLAQFEVFSAVNGKEGCVKAKELQPDLIISDIMMPELDGYGVLHILGRDPKTANIPFVFLSAKAEKSEIRKGMELGADDYLTKPFDEAELLNAIETRLRKFNTVAKNINIFNFENCLSGVDEEKIFGELFSQKLIKDYKKKQFIYNEGDEPAFLFYVNSGRVKIAKTNNEGKEFVTSVIPKGHFFGMTRLFEGKRYVDTAIAMEDTQLSKFSKDHFFDLILKNRDVAMRFIKILSVNVEEKEEELLNLAYNTVRKRTASALIKLVEVDEKNAENTKARIRITRDDLAAMVGTATETVIRCLSDFKQDGLIEVMGREIHVHDVKGLRDIPY